MLGSWGVPCRDGHTYNQFQQQKEHDQKKKKKGKNVMRVERGVQTTRFNHRQRRARVRHE
jgi:hypothetical protein